MLLRVKRLPILIIVCIIVVGVAVAFEYMQATSAPKTLQAIRCGALYLHSGETKAYKAFDGKERKFDTAQPIGDCFWHAYQHCQPAILTVAQLGADIGVTSMFTINQAHGKCVLIESTQSYTINTGGSRSPFRIYACANLVRNGNNLHFVNCGKNGDMLISF